LIPCREIDVEASYNRPVTFYRDPLAGLRSQIATKRGLLETREQKLPVLLRAMLPEALAERLARLRERVVVEADSLEALTGVDAALDEILAVHDEAAQVLPRLRDCPLDVPDPPKPPLSPPWVIEETYQLGFRSMLTRRLGQISPDAWLVRWDDSTYLSRVRVADAPIILSSRIDVTPAQPTTFRSTVRTSVPRATPVLEVRRERLLDGIGRAIGVVRDMTIGNEAFDEAFVVDADPEATALLSADVVQSLLELEHLEPRLAVKRGIAELVWGATYDAHSEPLMPDAALAVVLGIRAVIERA
jgi:hypothetical protein